MSWYIEVYYHGNPCFLHFYLFGVISPFFLWLKKPCIKNHGFWGPKVRLARDGITLQKRPVHFQPWPVQGILGPSPGSFAFGCLRPGGVGVGDGCFSSYKWSPYTWPKINGNVGIYDPTYRRGGAQFITSRGPPCIFCAVTVCAPTCNCWRGPLCRERARGLFVQRPISTDPTWPFILNIK